MVNGMAPKYLKPWMAGVSLLVLLLVVKQFSGPPRAAQEMNMADLAYRVSGLLKTQSAGTATREKVEYRPVPPFTLGWKDALGYLKRDWEKAPDIRCNKIQDAGNWKICMDGKHEVKTPCLVYSFGIFVDWTFDEHMSRMGCEVHSFDPSIGKEDHIHFPNVSFHNMGIGPIDTDTFEPENDKYVKTKVYWKVRTLKSIMEMLGHQGRKLDILKMDVESDEWETLIKMEADGLLPDIKQFLIEWHLYKNYPSRNRYSDFYHAYDTLLESGFRSYYKLFHHRDASEAHLTLQADVNYLNANYDN